MVLVDTSVWVSHLRHGNVGLDTLLEDSRVACHPFVVGELACGSLANRAEILILLQALPMSASVEHKEAMRLIEDHALMGKGLGYIDVHLLASAMLSDVQLWTEDKKLHAASRALGRSY